MGAEDMKQRKERWWVWVKGGWLSAFVGQLKCLMLYADELTRYLPLWISERCTPRFVDPNCCSNKHVPTHLQTQATRFWAPAYILPDLSARQLSRYVTRWPKVPIRPIYLCYLFPYTLLPILFPAAAPTVLSPLALNGFPCHYLSSNTPIYPRSFSIVSPNNVTLIGPLLHSVQKQG